MLPILHLVSLSDWDLAVERGEYAPGSLDAEGFIHFSTADQVAATAQRIYGSVGDLGLILVDGDDLDVRFEAPADDIAGGWEELFPHVYGSIDPNDVLCVAPYRTGAPWELPNELPAQRSLDGVRFTLADSTGRGQVSAATLFEYSEPGDGTVSASYSGGEIIEGHLIGWRALDRLRFRYVQVLGDGDVVVGQCQTRIVIGDQGRFELIESWRLVGREGSGTSRMISRSTTSPCE